MVTKAVSLSKEGRPPYLQEFPERRAILMSDFEILSVMLMFISVIVVILIEYIKK